VITKAIKKIIRGFSWILVVFLRKLYEASYRLDSPKLSAHLLCLFIKPLNSNKKYRVLCLGRSQFYDDIRALIKYGNKIQYFYFHKLLLGEIVRYKIPFDLDLSLLAGYSVHKENIQHSSFTEDGLTYHIDPKYNKSRKMVYSYFSEMFPILRRKLRFDAVMSGNYVYVDQQEFYKICEENNIPGIILNKEGIGAKQQSADGNWVDRGVRFIGSRMLFMNEPYMRSEIKHLKDFDKRNASLVGLPRFDFYANSPIRFPRAIVLFAFVVSDYFVTGVTDEMMTQLSRITEEFHKNVIDFALRNPKYKVVIKTKPAKRYLDQPKDIVKKYYGGTEINNLTITNNAKVEDLIVNSSVVLGYNSTALVEGIAANKPIISPDFNAVLGSNNRGVFKDYNDLLNYVTTYDGMEKIILNCKDYYSVAIDRKDQFLEPLIFKNDGKASQRAESAIIETIEERKRKSYN